MKHIDNVFSITDNVENYREDNIARRLYSHKCTVSHDSLNHVQLDDDGKPVRGVVADIMLYPTYNQRHYIVFKQLLKSSNTCTIYFHYKEHESDIIAEADNIRREHVHAIVLYDERKTNTAVAKALGVESNLVIIRKLQVDFGWRSYYGTHLLEDDKPQKYDLEDDTEFYFSNPKAKSLTKSYANNHKMLAEDMLKDFITWLRFQRGQVTLEKAILWTLEDRRCYRELLTRYKILVNELIKEHNHNVDYGYDLRTVKRKKA